MKKLGAIFKETSASRIKKYLLGSEAIFLIKYSGLSSPDLSALRLALKGSNADLFVIKNSVARRALKDSSLKLFVKNIDGPCGIIFSEDEPVGTSKALCTFSKTHERLQLECAIFKDKFLEKKDIELMASLPSKEALRAQLVMTLNSPISSFVITLNQLLSKFVICLDQIKQKKEREE